MPKQDDIRIRRGTKAAIDAMASGSRLEIGELAYSTDTLQLHVGNGPTVEASVLGGYMQLVGTAYVGGVQSGNVRGAGSLDVQSARALVTHVASGGSSVCIGYWCTASAASSIAIGAACTASSAGSIAIGNTAVASATGSQMIGSGSNNVANTILWQRTTAFVRGEVTGGNWVFTIQSTPTASVAATGSIADCPVGSLVPGTFRFRLNGNDLWIDSNIGGTIRSRNLGTLT